VRITLKDIAEKVGVTKAAVSLALRDHPRISEHLRKEVKQAAEELGYCPDVFLARLSAYRASKGAMRSEGVIAWLNHWAEPKRLRSYHEFEIYWSGAVLTAKRLGYRLQEVVWPIGCSAVEIEKKLVELGVLGLLIPPHKPDVDWGGFDWSRFSLIRFGLSVQKPDSNLVTSDHQRAMVMAVRRIHEYGYRRIGLIYNQAHDCAMGGNHYGSFIWASKRLGMDPPIPPLDSEAKTPELAACAKQNLKKWLKDHRPDAVLTSAPEAAVFLRELGYRIPEDLAVASTSPYDISVNAGIDQRPKEIGKIAAEMLIKQISLNERGEPADPCRILVESVWRDGKSLPRENNAT
jgi:LacI family transcriptional regulator